MARFVDNPILPVERVVFGGSFDPPHTGHFAMAREILKTGAARSLIFMPAAISPLKLHEPPASAQMRLRMLQLGMEELLSDLVGQGRIGITELEIHRPPPSYTIDSCLTLSERYPGESLALLMGSDSLFAFPGWREYCRLAELYPIFVFVRANDSIEELRKHIEDMRLQCGGDFAGIHLLTMDPVPCSSSQIRPLLAGRKNSVSALEMLRLCLPPSVLALIEKEELYL